MKKYGVMGLIFLIVAGCAHDQVSRMADDRYEIVSEVPSSLAFPSTERAQSLLESRAREICPRYEVVEFKKVDLSWLHGRTYYKMVIRCRR